jgi:hypothetical protein
LVNLPTRFFVLLCDGATTSHRCAALNRSPAAVGIQFAISPAAGWR